MSLLDDMIKKIQGTVSIPTVDGVASTVGNMFKGANALPDKANTSNFALPIPSLDGGKPTLSAKIFEPRTQKEVDNTQQIDERTEGFLQSVSKFPLWTRVSNALFDVDQRDQDSAQRKAGNLMIEPYVAPQRNLKAESYLTTDESVDAYNKIQQNKEDKANKDKIEAKSFLADMGKYIGEEKVQEIINEKRLFTKELTDMGDRELKKYVQYSPIGQQNVAETALVLKDFANELSNYNIELATQIRIAEGKGDRINADMLRSQQDNSKTVFSKVVEHVQYLTEYKIKNKGASDQKAEDAWEEYVQGKGYIDTNHFMLDGMIGYDGNQISKDGAAILSQVQTWEDEMNYIKDTNVMFEGMNSEDKNAGGIKLVLGSSNYIVGQATNPLARLFDKTLNVVGAVAKPVASLMGVDIGNTLNTYSGIASADLGEIYGVDASTTKKDIGDISAGFWNNLGDKVPDSMAALVPMFLGGGLSAPTALKNVAYMSDTAKAVNTIQKVENIATKFTPWMVKTGLGEVIVNSAFDKNDPQFMSRDNLMFNILGSFITLGIDGSKMLKETGHLNSEIVRISVNNQLEQRYILDEMNKGLTELEAIQKFKNLPVSEKGKLTVSPEFADNLKRLYNSIKEDNSKKKISLQKQYKVAGDKEKALIEGQLREMNQAEKEGAIKQALLNRLLRSESMSNEEAVAFAKILKDVENPNVLVRDIYGLLQKHIFNGASGASILSDVGYSIANKGKVIGNYDFLSNGRYVYRDGAVNASYIKGAINLEPGATYSFAEVVQKGLDAAKVSKQDGVSLANEIMQKEGNNYKYFNEVDGGYSLNKEGLKKLNMDYNTGLDKTLNSIEEGFIKGETTDKFIDIVTQNAEELGLTADQLAKIVDNNVFDVISGVLKQFIPCK